MMVALTPSSRRLFLKRENRGFPQVVTPMLTPIICGRACGAFLLTGGHQKKGLSYWRIAIHDIGFRLVGKTA